MAETERERIVRELRHTSQHLEAASGRRHGCGACIPRLPSRWAHHVRARDSRVSAGFTRTSRCDVPLAGGTADNRGIAEVLLFIADMLEE